MRKDKVVSEVLGEESALAPSDLYSREFKRAMVGGYDPNEVDEFLERVADQLESLIVQVRELKERNEGQRARIEEYHEMESTLRSALASSQKFGEDLLDAAKREAQAIIEEARARKAVTEHEIAKMPMDLSNEIWELREQRNRLKNEMLAILDTHRLLIERQITADKPVANKEAVAEERK